MNPVYPHSLGGRTGALGVRPSLWTKIQIDTSSSVFVVDEDTEGVLVSN